MLKLKILFVVILVLVDLPAGSMLSQSDDSPGSLDSVYTFRVYQDLVLLDVVVTDRKGTPIKNLTRDNFTILEDDVSQKISTFDYEDLSTALGPATETSTPAEHPAEFINLTKSPLEQIPRKQFQHRRLLILFFDLSSMPVEDLIQAQKTALNYVEKQLTPADLVAVVANASSLNLLQNFTNDPAALTQALQKLSIGDSASLAELGTTNSDDTTTTDVSDAYTADETQYNIFNTDRKLSAIESVGKMFRYLPEKKFLIHFSSGISTTGVENQAQIRSTVNTLNQSDTSLYAVDARGLIAAPPGGDASTGSASGNANYTGKAVRDQFASMANSQETLTTLALDTGGKALLDTNDLGRVFEAVRQDSLSYYLVGYNSSNSKRDGKYRRIKVTVNVSGARLTHRKGYFAPKSFSQYSKSDKERQLEEAVTTERPFSEIPFLIATNFIRANSQQVFVPISLKFTAADVPFQQKGKKTQADFDFIGQVRGAKNSVVSAVRDTIRIDLDPEAYKRVSGGDIQYQTGFYLKPGNYDLKFLLRENQTGKLSAFEQALEVPDYGNRGLSMSSIILSSRVEPVGQRTNTIRKLASIGGGPPASFADPDLLVVDGKRMVPNVARVFSSSDTLYIFFQMYLNSARKSSPDLTASLTFSRNGARFREAPNLHFDQFDEGSKDTITCHFQLPLTQFIKGDYTLQVDVSDHRSPENLEGAAHFVMR